MTASLHRLSAIARTTFTELVRLRTFYVLLLFAVVLILSATFLSRISFQQELQVTRDITLGAINFFTCLLAIVATAQLLPRDLEDRVVYSILAKPVWRFEYLLGKFFGVVALLAVSLVAMSLISVAVLYLREQTALREVATQFASLPGDQSAAALRAVHEAGVNQNLVAAFGLILVKAAVLVAMTLLISSFATSNIFTISAMAMAYLIGHLEGIARDYWFSEHAVGWGTRLFLALIVLVFPDLQSFSWSDQIGAAGATLLRTAPLALFYIVGYLLTAIAIFSQREL